MPKPTFRCTASSSALALPTAVDRKREQLDAQLRDPAFVDEELAQRLQAGEFDLQTIAARTGTTAFEARQQLRARLEAWWRRWVERLGCTKGARSHGRHDKLLQDAQLLEL